MNWLKSAGFIGALVLGWGSISAAPALAQANLPGPSASPMMGMPMARPLPQANVGDAAALPARGAQDENYKLGSGDKLRLVVYGEEDLGGEYLVDGSGEVQLPLLGQMPAAGMSIHEFQTSIGNKFVSEGYLKDPRISVEVENYRPFYIIGEVKTPGQYPYVSGMNVLNAVALAGGFTYRADDKVVYVRRSGSQQELKTPADQTTRINPGDIIRIDERVF
jgi:protein involved in polysaccharide export with SLBB domain